MARRFSMYGIALVFGVCLYVFIVSNKLINSPVLERAFLDIGRTIQSCPRIDMAATKPTEVIKSCVRNDVTATNYSENITEVLSVQRQLIADEMSVYRYPAGRSNISARTLEELVPETGGQPIRNIVITTWRSGSTFLGDVLDSHPANFYHYEPLLDYEIIQIRDEPSASEALKVLRSLLNCDYSGLDHYLAYGKKHTELFIHNSRLWKQCEKHPLLCWRPEFLTPFCRLFPFQSMKVVRLRLRLVEEFLDDDSFNVRVLYLVRDPRGTLQSRKHRTWCPGHPDCNDPGRLCSDLDADYEAASKLAAKFPSRFRAIRYEDLSIEPHTGVQDLFNFFGLDFHPKVQRFLDTHTKANKGGVSSTFRDSKSAPFQWRLNLTHSEVLTIQQSCQSAMDVWGYQQAINSSHQKEFNPVGDFELMDLGAVPGES